MGLADDDIRHVLARAQQIQHDTLPDAAEVETLIHAAEQVGVPRAAVERALRERWNLPLRPPAVGELIFARSADDKFYVAEVLTVSGNDVRVRFLRGGEHTITLSELRPCTLLPGERVVCPWPSWGPWTCTVLSYDATGRHVNVSDGWGETHRFPLDKIWVAPRKDSARTRTRVYAKLIGAGAAAGAVIGSILTLLILG